MDLSRESIERRDFPLARRGYAPAAVDAHLRTVAEQAQELSQRAASVAEPTLSLTAATQVQSILEAAQATAAEIESDATEDARSIRDEAVGRAREHVQAVAQATAALHRRVEAMDGELGTLLESLRVGLGRLAADLSTVEERMAELYEAAGRPSAVERQIAAPPSAPGAVKVEATALVSAPHMEEAGATAPVSAPSVEEAGATAHVPLPAGGSGGEDIDGARLVALNMALSGEPREQTDRYLADSFKLADREKLLDEVYAAIEG